MQIGIDFGTCFSSAAFLDGETLMLVKDPTSLSYSIPSSVFVSPQKLVFVGKIADNRRLSDPTRYRHEIKRDLGKQQPLLLGEQTYLPEQLIAVVLSKIKRDADALLSSSGQRAATGAVLTIPATYQESKRKLMLNAAVQAGFVAEEVTLLEEPVAAALYYGHKSKMSEGETLLVYDLGGGTFDAALLQKRGEAFEYLALPSGIERLGGIDFDRAIYGDLVKQHPELRALLQGERTDRAALMTRIQVRELCTSLKHQLSEETEAEISFVVPESGAFVTYSLTQEAFNHMISAAVQQTITRCQQMLQQANITNENVGSILLVGGSCRIPLIQHLLQQQFKCPLIAASDLELVVCQGAALYAATHKIYTVSPTQGEADYTTIGAAIQAVRPLDQIVVRSGTYHEDIVLDRDVTILGAEAADKIIIESAADIGIHMAATTASIHGITLRHSATQVSTWQRHGAVVISKGKLTLENCIVEAKGHGISVWGEESNATLRGCSIRADINANVALNNGGQASIEACHLTSNADAGVYVRGKGSILSIQHSHVHDNDGIGISISSAGQGQIENCHIFANGKVGIQIRDEGSTATISQSHIRNGADKGVAVWEKATATIEDCAIFNNVHAGIFVSGEDTSANIKQSQIHHGKYIGVDIAYKATASFEACQVYSNTGVGIRAKDEGSTVTIENCHIYDGVYCGILIQRKAHAELSGSKLLKNIGPGIRISDAGSKANVNNCTIQLNAVGIVVENVGEVILENTTVEKNRIDIYVEPGSCIQPASPAQVSHQNLWQLTPEPEVVKLLNTFNAQEPVVVQTFENNGKAPIYAVAISPDGKTLASGSTDKTVKLWDVHTGSLLKVLSGHTSVICSVVFSPDGSMLASGSADNTIKLWKLEDGTLLRALSGHTSGVYSVAFSPDGSMLASGSADNTIRLWDINTGSLLRALSGHVHYVYSVVFSPDGSMLASGSYDKTIKLWKWEDGSLLRTLSGHTQYVCSVAFNLDGSVLASGSHDKTIKLWEINTGNQLKTLSGHTQYVYSVAFNLDGSVLASGSHDKTIKLWDVEDGSLVKTLIEHTNVVRSVVFSPDGGLLGSGGDDGTIKLWR